MFNLVKHASRHTKVTQVASTARALSTCAGRGGVVRRGMSVAALNGASTGKKGGIPSIYTQGRRSMQTEEVERDMMEYDVLIVGGGPAGLSAAIRLKKLAAEKGQELNVCLIDKGSEIGAHIMSGNVFQPTFLSEIIPDWKERENSPFHTPVTSDHFYFTTEHFAAPLPHPKSLHNEGNYIISLGALCKFLSEEAEAVGVEIYNGFAAAQVVYEDGIVRGVITGDVGIGKNGQPTDSYQPGMILRAKQTFFAEGTRGSCSEELIEKYKLREGKSEQTYGIGLKEIWEIDASKSVPGKVVHTVGYPLPADAYSGAFMYQMQGNLVHLGIVIGLDYENPYLNPYEEFQRWKTLPMVKEVLEGGKCISYGARALNEGGYQSLPKVVFPGGALLGCSAGMVNVPKIKGSHNAMKSGIEAAESLFNVLAAADNNVEALDSIELTEYNDRVHNGTIGQELHAVRNVRPGFQFGQLGFLINSGLELFVTKGKSKWTLTHDVKDADCTQEAKFYTPIQYPKHDGVLTFDLLENLARTGVNHAENQPSHLKIKTGMEAMPEVSFKKYAAPESRFCPAGVYEYIQQDDGKHKLQINAQNCIHCKTCSIKTPKEFIKWTVPQGGDGPNYQNM